MHHTGVGKSRHKLPFQVGTGKENRPISFCVAFAAQTKWWHVEIGYMAQRVAIYSTPRAPPLVFFGPQMWEKTCRQCQPSANLFFSANRKMFRISRTANRKVARNTAGVRAFQRCRSRGDQMGGTPFPGPKPL